MKSRTSAKSTLRAIAGALLASSLLATPAVVAEPVLIEAARYLDVEGGELVAPARILVEDGRITALNPESVPQEALRVDLGERTLLPGLLGRRLEVRGGASQVQVFDGSTLRACHPRGTKRRVVLDPAHYDGPSTDTVQAPTPLGRMGKKLEAIAAMAPERRPLDLYAALAEAAR